MPTVSRTADAVLKKTQARTKTADAHVGQPPAKLARFHSHYHLISQIEVVDLADQPNLHFTKHTHDRSQVGSTIRTGRRLGMHSHHARQVGIEP